MSPSGKEEKGCLARSTTGKKRSGRLSGGRKRRSTGRLVKGKKHFDQKGGVRRTRRKGGSHSLSIPPAAKEKGRRALHKGTHVYRQEGTASPTRKGKGRGRGATFCKIAYL